MASIATMAIAAIMAPVATVAIIAIMAFIATMAMIAFMAMTMEKIDGSRALNNCFKWLYRRRSHNSCDGYDEKFLRCNPCLDDVLSQGRGIMAIIAIVAPTL